MRYSTQALLKNFELGTLCSGEVRNLQVKHEFFFQCLADLKTVQNLKTKCALGTRNRICSQLVVSGVLLHNGHLKNKFSCIHLLIKLLTTFNNYYGFKF